MKLQLVECNLTRKIKSNSNKVNFRKGDMLFYKHFKYKTKTAASQKSNLPMLINMCDGVVF